MNMNKMKKILILVLLLTGVVGLQAQEVVEAIVAIVNDDYISLSQYKQRHDEFVQALRAQVQGEEFSKQYELIKTQILDRMITDLLLLQEARKANMDPTEQVNMTIERIKNENGFTTDDQLRQAMAQQGVNFVQWKEQLEETIMTQNIIYRDVGSHIVIDDSQIIAYYKKHPDEFTDPPEVTLKAITISSENKTEDEAQEKKRDIVERLDSGEDFAAVAGELSEGAEKESGGDLGSFKEGELEATLSEAISKINPGERTVWLNFRGNWIMLQLVERKASRLKPFDEVRGEVEQKLFNEQRDVGVEKYLVELRERSYIKILIPNPMDR